MEIIQEFIAISSKVEMGNDRHRATVSLGVHGGQRVLVHVNRQTLEDLAKQIGIELDVTPHKRANALYLTAGNAIQTPSA